MKYLLFALLILCHSFLLAQGTGFIIKVQQQTIKISTDSANDDKVLLLNSNKKLLKNDKLTIYNNNKNEFKQWNRSFIIFDKADAELLKISGAKSYTEVDLKDVYKKLTKNNEYYLYTVSLPKDERKAALVKVRRILICKIRLK